MEKGIVIIYFGILFGTLFLRKMVPSGTADYLLAGRRLTLLPFLATLVSTAYGWILGVGELYYNFGISAWLFLSLPYSLAALGVAFFLAGKARKQRFTTLSDLLFIQYGKRTGLLGTLLFVWVCSPAMYLLMAGQIVHFIFDWPMWLAVTLVTLLSTVYLYKGGFKALVRTDLIQFVWMFGGFALLLGALYHTYGVDPLLDLPTEKKTFHSEASPWYLIAWFLLAGFTLIDPNFYQRIYATDSPKTARKGLFLAVICWTVFDFLAASTALYALGKGFGSDNPGFVYLETGRQVLPDWGSGIFLAGLLAAVMSTVDSFIFYSSLTLARDFLKKLGLGGERSVPQLTQILLPIVSLAALILTFFYLEDTAVDLFLEVQPIAISALLLPVLTAYGPKWALRGSLTFLQMITGFAVSLVYQLFHSTLIEVNPFWEQINSIYPGLLASLLFYVVAKVAVRKTNEVRRVILLGGESSGKTTLAQELLTELGGEWVPEYLREVFEEKEGKLLPEDSILIAEGQLLREEGAASRATQWLFGDTDPWQTVAYHRHYFGEVPEELMELARSRQVNHYLLLRPDLNWKPDPQRDSKGVQEKIFLHLEKLLIEEKLPYSLIGGKGEERLENALAALDQNLSFPEQ